MLTSDGGQRRVPVEHLLAGSGRTKLTAGEVISAFEVATRPTAGYGYHKIKRSGSSWPIVTAAAIAALDEQQQITARLTIGGVCTNPVRIDLVEADLLDRNLRDVVEDRLRHSTHDSFSDVLATTDYRMAVAPSAARGALTQALNRRANHSREPFRH